jgi:hypothetical protein
VVEKNLPDPVEGCCLLSEPSEGFLSISHQCALVGLSPSSYYYHPIPVSPKELDLMQQFEQFHFEHPYFDSRQITVNMLMSRSKTRRLMRELHIVATYPQPKAMIPNHDHKFSRPFTIFPMSRRNFRYVIVCRFVNFLV